MGQAVTQGSASGVDDSSGADGGGRAAPAAASREALDDLRALAETAARGSAGGDVRCAEAGCAAASVARTRGGALVRARARAC